MDILKLVIGEEDAACLLCRYPDEGDWPGFVPFPWPMCPVHFGELNEDPYIQESVKLAADIPDTGRKLVTTQRSGFGSEVPNLIRRVDTGRVRG